MTLEENEQEIYDALEKNKFKLYITLLKKINSDTNAHFYNVNKITYSPTLDSSLEVIKGGTNSNAFIDRGNGVVSLKGAVLKYGWPNTLWEMSVDIKFDYIKYTGLILLADPDTVSENFGWGATGGVWGIRNWEGPVTGTPYKSDGTVGNFTKTPNVTLRDGTRPKDSIPWYTLHVKKTSFSTLEVWKNDDIENKVVYEWEELSDVLKVTFGANTNFASTSTQSEYGSMFIRNLNVTYYPLPSFNHTVTQFCEDTKKIKSDTNNVTTVPGQPTTIQGNNLGTTEQNILNKVQYCNNVLRYTLRKNGIEFNNSNKMHELIKFINQIMMTPTINIDDAYSAYVNLIQLSGDKSIIQANETYNLIAEVVDKGAGISIDFIQKFKHFDYVDSNNWTITGSPIITNGSEYTTITTDGTTTAIVKNNVLLQGDFKIGFHFNSNNAIRISLQGTDKEWRVTRNDGEWRYYEITRTNGVITARYRKSNGTSWTTQSSFEENTLTSEDCYFRFYITVPSGDARAVMFHDLDIDASVGISTTNANGIATCSLIGDGSGEKTYYAKENNIVSDDVNIIDGIICLKAISSNITHLNRFNTTNIQIIGNKFDFATIKENNDGVYSGLYWNSDNNEDIIPISNLKGKSFTCLIKDVEFEESMGANWNIKVYQKINNGSWANITNSDNFIDGDNSVTFDVDSNATHLWVRIQPSNNDKSYHIRTGEWVIYSIESED